MFDRSGGVGGSITGLLGRGGLEGTGFVGPKRAVGNLDLAFELLEKKAGMNAQMRVSEPWNGEGRVSSMERAEV